MSDFESQVAAVFSELDHIDLIYKPSRETLGKFFLASVAANILGFASLIALGVVAQRYSDKKNKKETNDE